jgi:hypothetical protein
VIKSLVEELVFQILNESFNSNGRGKKKKKKKRFVIVV